MRIVSFESVALIVALAAASAPEAFAQQPGQPVQVSLDSLLNTRISAASKYSQTSAEAPASITILTADDIQRYGWRNLQEVFESVNGFYVSNDRNYPYLGVRGFSRPTDYNDRILLLVDGHAMNEHVWGSAPVGSDFPIDLDAIERIEIVRGPGSVLYGTNAMFAVINVVTKTGTELDGVVAGTRLGSGGARQAVVAAGRPLGARASWAVSGLISRSDGNDLYYPEYDTPRTNHGVVHGLDWEDGISGIGSVRWNDLTAQVGYKSRAKGIPTGSFGSAFGDSRAMTVDESLWAELTAAARLGSALSANSRLYADRYRYRGVYPIDSGPASSDGALSEDVGAEQTLIWDPTSRIRLTIGGEYVHVAHARYYERQADGTATSDDAPYNVTSIFAQGEVQLLPGVTLVGGLRHDERALGRRATTPRVAIVTTPDKFSTLKLLYGEAFRAPSAAEADLTTSFYTRDPALRPERMRTAEVEFDRRIGAWLLLGASVYKYWVRDLIDQVAIDSAGTLQFRNLQATNATGVELNADLVPEGPVAAHLSYSRQRARADSGSARLTNSPEQIARLSFTASGFGGVRSAVEVRYESGRLTLAGSTTPSFVRTDLDVGGAPFPRSRSATLRAMDVSVRVTNLFGTAYSVPGGVEHLQAAIAQEGRTFLFRADWHF